MTKFAVTAEPDTFPLRNPLNCVLAVTKLAVNAVPETLPCKKPFKNVAVTAEPETLPDKKPENISVVKLLVAALKLIFASVTNVKPIAAVLTFTNVG